MFFEGIGRQGQGCGQAVKVHTLAQALEMTVQPPSKKASILKSLQSLQLFFKENLILGKHSLANPGLHTSRGKIPLHSLVL